MAFKKLQVFRRSGKDPVNTTGKTSLAVIVERFLSSDTLQVLFQEMPLSRSPWETALTEALSLLETATGNTSCREGTYVGPDTVDQLWKVTSMLLKALYCIEQGEPIAELGIKNYMEGILHAIAGLKPSSKFVIGMRLVSRLVEAYPESLSHVDSKGRWPLHVAVATKANAGRAQLVEFLVEAKPTICQLQDPVSGQFPVNLAIDNNYPMSVVGNLCKAAPNTVDESLVLDMQDTRRTKRQKSTYSHFAVMS